MSGTIRSAETEPIITISPRPRAIIPGMTARVAPMRPATLVSMTHSDPDLARALHQRRNFAGEAFLSHELHGVQEQSIVWERLPSTSSNDSVASPSVMTAIHGTYLQCSA